MAEEVCSQALARRLRVQRHNSQLHTAWNALEYGLSLQQRPEYAGVFFDYAEDAFTAIFERGEKAVPTINAQLGALFMPAYRARFADETLTGRALTRIHLGIADMLETFDQLYDPRGLDKFAGIKPELVTLALFARLRSPQWLAYPAAPREENTQITDFNHDCYVIRGNIKVPIQVKRKNGGGYDPSVAVVKLKHIMDRVNQERRRRTMQEWGMKRRVTRPLAELDYNDFSALLVKEARGGWLDEHEAWLLEVGSMAAVREVMGKEEIIRAKRSTRNIGEVALAA